jgi:tRNA A-37 threonylcarbamoyl transferase component Bud32/membrane-associated phospholipid phosphatase
MDSTPRQVLPEVVGPTRRGAHQVRQSGRRRRPSGEAPPLPHHLHTSGVGWLVALVVLVVLSIVVFGGGLRGPAVTVTVLDDAMVRWLAGLDAPGLEGTWQALAFPGSWWFINLAGFGLVLALLALRRFRHLILAVIVAQLLTTISENVLGSSAQRPRPFGVVIETSWGGWALPSQVMHLAATLVVVLYTLVPEGRWRQRGKLAAAGVVTLAGLGRIALGAEAPTDVLVGAAIGVAIPLALFRLFAPNEVFPISYRRGRAAHLDVTGTRGAAIRRGLEDQLGLTVTQVEPFGLSGSAGSTPLRIHVDGGGKGTYLFGKLYAKSHLRSDRWYKLGRELLYGRLEDEKAFNTVRRLVQQEDYALRLMRDAGLPSPEPFGIVEITPEREYLLVTEFCDGSVELGEAEVDDAIIDDGLVMVRKLWAAGLAHRDIKPANLLVQHDRLRLIDVFFTEVRPSPWRQAVDLANMMLCLALRTDAPRVYQRALELFTVEEISEAFAAARGIALPSQLRRMMRAQGRNLHDEFIKLMPGRPPPVSIQRWSARRIVLSLLVLLAAVIAVPSVVSSSIADPSNASLPTTDLTCRHPEPMLLMAQSVRSSSRVPCVEVLPAGWSVSGARVNNGWSRISLDNERAGPGALVVWLRPSCSLTGAVEVPSDEAGARRYERIDRLAPAFRATRSYVFPGGCTTYEFNSRTSDRAELTNQASLAVGFIGRDTLTERLRVRSHGRLRLDRA